MKNLYENPNVAKATVDMFAAWKEDDETLIQAAAQKWSEAIFEQIRSDAEMYSNDTAALAARGYRILTSEEKHFYEALAKKGLAPNANSPAVSDILPLLPVTVITDVYKHLTNEHPLLDAIDFQNLGYVTTMVFNNHTSQNAAWGAIPRGITQEITSSFRSFDLKQSKLTCFMYIPLDLLRMGATFLDQYVRTVLTETMAGSLEAAIVTGTGKEMPIGMDRKVDSQAVVTDGVYAKKSAIVITDFDPATYGALIADNLLVADNGHVKTPIGELVLVCNAIDYMKKIMPATTVQNALGQYIGDILPVPTRIIPTGALNTGDAIIGYAKEYACGIAAPKTGALDTSDEFKFLDDTRTFKSITYANGRAFDNSSFALLDISGLKPANLKVQVVEDGPEGATGATGATGTTA